MKLLSSLFKRDANGASMHRLDWLASLQNLNDTERLKVSVNYLTTLLNDSTLTVHEKISLILKLREANQVTVLNQLGLYAKSEQLKPEYHHVIIDTNYAYHRILFLALSKLIKICQEKPSQSLPDSEKKIALISGAILAATAMLEWRFFEHAPAPANLWKQTSELFQIATSWSITQNPVQDSSLHHPSSIQALFLQLFMMGGLNYTNLSKPQLDILCELIGKWSTEIRVKSKLEPYHTYYIDLTKDQPARRIRKSTPAHLCLYWDLDEIEYTIDLAIKSLDDNKLPSIMSEIRIQNPMVVREALIFLKREWSRNQYRRQRRKEERQETSKFAMVTTGFYAICELLGQYAQQQQHVRTLLDGTVNEKKQLSSLKLQGQQNTLLIGNEKWQITDESQLGFGSLVNSQKQFQIKPNRLLAIFIDKYRIHPAIGVVRNYKQVTAGHFKIGMEIYSDKPFLVQLRPFPLKKDDASISNANAPQAHSQAIFSPGNPFSGSTSTLIMAKSDFIRHCLYEIIFPDQKREIVKLETPVEYGDDWIKVNFPENLLI